MIRGAIFDMDGTLLDSMSIWHTLGEDYLRSLGLEPRENLRETFKTFSTEQAARYYRDHYGVALSVPEIVAGINGLIGRFYREEAPLRPGVADFLHRLQAAGVKMCIATATDRALAQAALTRCGVWDCFDGIFTCAEVGCGKERPDIYEAALHFLGTARADTWVFEDAFHAAATAAGAGFPVLGVYEDSEQEQAGLRRVSRVYLPGFDRAQPFRAAAGLSLPD